MLAYRLVQRVLVDLEVQLFLVVRPDLEHLVLLGSLVFPVVHLVQVHLVVQILPSDLVVPVVRSHHVVQVILGFHWVLVVPVVQLLHGFRVFQVARQFLQMNHSN